MAVPALRLRAANDAPLARGGKFVLYWMTAARRTRWSFALDRALELARELRRPLLVLEPLRCDYLHASPRFHRFVVDGMADQARRFAAAGIAYRPWVEPAPGAGKGLLARLARDACLVVGDDWPCFMHPRMAAAAARQVPCRLELVDGNGLLPLRAAERAYPTAAGFRRHLQRALPVHLLEQPAADPLAGAAELPRAPDLPDDVLRRWPAVAPDALERLSFPAGAPEPVQGVRGGSEAGRARLRAFVTAGLARYLEDKDHPDRHATSRLSPWLHFGQVGAHEALGALAWAEGWTPAALSCRADGKREGFWGMSPPAEAWLEQLVTWRELSFNWAAHRPADFDRFASVPEWARRTLADHADDPREWIYTREELEQARTHDEVWNAAQRQLVREGTIHTYLRMLWGKKVLEWSRTPAEAFATLVELNDRYALDGRDPNSYSGIAWCFGRHDRPWGPVRPVFGTVRFMSCESARRKLRLRAWLARFST